MFQNQSVSILSIMVLCSVFSYILNLSIYVQYYILAVKNICKNKTFVHSQHFPVSISLSSDLTTTGCVDSGCNEYLKVDGDIEVSPMFIIDSPTSCLHST